MGRDVASAPDSPTGTASGSSSVTSRAGTNAIHTAASAPPLARHLLWVDCAAGAIAGIAVLALAEWLSRVEGLPVGVLRLTGAANLAYAAYSFSLAVRSRRSVRGLAALVVAKAAWAVVCLVLALAFGASATWLGLAHLVGESVFVGGLAWAEWANRAAVVTEAAA